jgi:hypothetical protein
MCGLACRMTAALEQGIPVLPAVKDIQAHHHATRRLRSAYNPVPGCAHRHFWPTSNVRRFQILPYDSRSLHSLARNHSHAGHHGRDSGQSLPVRKHNPLRMPANHHQRPGTTFRVTTFLRPARRLFIRSPMALWNGCIILSRLP